MKLRSQKKPRAPEGNYVCYKIGNVTKSADLLALKVYDEDDNEYTIGTIFEEVLSNKTKLEETNLKLNQELANQKEVNIKLKESLDKVLDAYKLLVTKINDLTSDVNKLKK